MVTEPFQEVEAPVSIWHFDPISGLNDRFYLISGL
jgi:hypothetical protein